MRETKIREVIGYIKEQIGYDLSKYAQPSKKRKYFNLEFDSKIDYFDNVLIKKLERLASPTGVIKDIQPNGYSRLAVFI